MFLFAAMTSIALASCTTDEEIFAPINQGNEIELVAANYAAQTRAEHDTLTFTNNSYNVWAWENGSDVPHINGAYVSYTNNQSVLGNTYYWPNYALDFAATTPANDPRITLVRDNGTSTITFTINAEKGNDHQTNLMYADFVESQYYDSDVDFSNTGGETITGTTNSKTVALLFRHVLTRLNVVVNQVNPNPLPADITGYNVTVNSLSFNDFLNEGSLTVKEGEYDALTHNVWNTPGTATDSWNIISAATSIEASSFKTNYNHGAKNYFVMPQTIPANAKLNINYTVITRFSNGTTSTETYTKSVALNTITSGNTAIDKWFTNKNVTYTINIKPANLTEIAFTVNEEEMGTIGGSHTF